MAFELPFQFFDHSCSLLVDSDMLHTLQALDLTELALSLKKDQPWKNDLEKE